MTTSNAYDALYENMKNRFTVVNDGSEYTLGEYMLMKAANKPESAKLPVATKSAVTRADNAVALFVSYVNDKLTIKQPPVKDKTIRAFPFRTSLSALLSAVVACTFTLCFGIIGARMLSSDNTVDEASITEYAPETDINSEYIA